MGKTAGCWDWQPTVDPQEGEPTPATVSPVMRAHVLVRSLHCSSGTNCSSYTRITEICHTNMRNATCYTNYVVTCFLFRSVSWMTERSSRSIKARSSYTANSPKLLMEAELFRALPVHLVRKTGSLPVTFKQRSLLKAWCPLFFSSSFSCLRN